MTYRSLLAPLAALALLAPPLAAQQTSQQGKTDSAAVAAQATQIAQAQLDGSRSAANVGTGGWFGGGFASGVLLGLIGTGVSWAVAANSQVELPPDKRLLIATQSVTYQHMYEKSFGDRVRAKRKSSALAGGLVGTGALLLVVLSAQ